MSALSHYIEACLNKLEQKIEEAKCKRCIDTGILHDGPDNISSCDCEAGKNKKQKTLIQADYGAVVSICTDAVRDQYRMGNLTLPKYTLHIVQIVLEILERNNMICELRRD